MDGSVFGRFALEVAVLDRNFEVAVRFVEGVTKLRVAQLQRGHELRRERTSGLGAPGASSEREVFALHAAHRSRVGQRR